MMRSTLEGRTAKRRQPGAVASKFKVAVVRKKLIRPHGYEFCELIDISHGGIGIASQWLDAKVGQKLYLELHYGRKKYSARGIVTRIATQDKIEHYGVAFIYAPPELDLLIKLFVEEHPAAPPTPTAHLENKKKRPRGTRIAIQDAQVYAKKSAATDPFFLCQVDNISKNGMGFYCPSKIDKTVPFPISLRISMPPDATEITGTVHHVSKKSDTYYYGMEFELVSMEFVRLLDTLEEISAYE